MAPYGLGAVINKRNQLQHFWVFFSRGSSSRLFPPPSVASKFCGVWRWYGCRPTGNCLTYSANRVVSIWAVSVSAAAAACEFVHLNLLFSSDLPPLVHFSCFFISFLQKCSLMNCLPRLTLQTVIDELWTRWSIRRLCNWSQKLSSYFLAPHTNSKLFFFTILRVCY